VEPQAQLRQAQARREPPSGSFARSAEYETLIRGHISLYDDTGRHDLVQCIGRMTYIATSLVRAFCQNTSTISRLHVIGDLAALRLHTQPRSASFASLPRAIRLHARGVIQLTYISWPTMLQKRLHCGLHRSR